MSQPRQQKDMSESRLETNRSVIRNSAGNRMLVFGADTPAAADKMAKGAIWQNTDTGAVKYNSGTVASPTWTAFTGSTTATILADGCTLQDAGALDATFAFTQQTGSAPTITVPDYAGADQALATLNLAQTWLQAQTFKYGKFLLNDNNDTHALTVNWEENDTSARALDIKVNDGDRILDLGGNLVLAGTWTHTGAHAVGITTGASTTLVFPAGGANFEVIAALNTSFAQGDLLQLNAAGAWEILAVGGAGETLTTDGTSVSWGSVTSANATNLLDGCTLQDTGVLDAILAFTEQTGSAPTITFPDYAGANQTIATLNLAQEWLQAQTFKYGKFLINDNNDSHALTINWEENDSAARALDIKVSGADRVVTLGGDITLTGDLITVGDDSLTFNTAAATSVTLPTSGTLINSTGALDGGSCLNLTALGVKDNSGAGSFEMQIICSSTFAASDRALTFAPGDAARTLTLGGDITITGDLITVGDDSLTFTTGGATDVTLPTTGTLASLAGTEVLSNKVLTLPQINDTSSDHQYVFAVNELAADRNVTLPLLGAADEFVFKTHAVALANKTIDADSNTLTNINADELDPTTLGATSAYAVPFIITKVLTDLPDTGTDIYTDNCPFKLQILDAWALATTANGGTWAVHKGKVGAIGNAFVEAVTVAGTDKLLTRAQSCDDDYQEIASGGSIVAIGDAGDALDIKLTLLVMRSD